MLNIAGILLALSLLPMLGGCSSVPGPTPGEAAAATEGEVSQPGTEGTGPDGHSSRNALDWAGSYSGVVPCASCPGIETTVTLNEDGSYQRSLLYIDERPTPHVSTGKFVWDEAGRTVTLQAKGEGAQRYQVGENRLLQLDRDGQRIDGALAARYVLHKHLKDPQIEDRRWVLVELRGQPVEATRIGRDAFIILTAMDSRVSGDASCNSLMSTYAIMSGNRIRFGKNVARTRMACPDMRMEARFLHVLTMADNYRVGDDGILSLNLARMPPLARFVEVEAAD